MRVKGFDANRKMKNRGTSLIRHTPPVGPYSSSSSRVLRGTQGGGPFLVSKVPRVLARIARAPSLGLWIGPLDRAREGERERERERERETHTQRERDRYTDKKSGRDRSRDS